MRATGFTLIAVAAGVIGLGLWTVGGPGQARAERRDEVRMADLRDLGRHQACLQRQGLAPGDRSDSCRGETRRDPLSGDPYRVEIAGGLRVCARFETGLPRQRWAERDGFDPDTGCLWVGPQTEGAP